MHPYTGIPQTDPAFLFRNTRPRWKVPCRECSACCVLLHTNKFVPLFLFLHCSKSGPPVKPGAETIVQASTASVFSRSVPFGFTSLLLLRLRIRTKALPCLPIAFPASRALKSGAMFPWCFPPFFVYTTVQILKCQAPIPFHGSEALQNPPNCPRNQKFTLWLVDATGVFCSPCISVRSAQKRLGQWVMRPFSLWRALISSVL